MTRRTLSRGFLGATALAAMSMTTPAAAQHIDRIVAFGDSYADDGNLFEILGFNPAPQVYPTGRFSGGTNYIDTLSLLLNVPVDNYAIGGALTNNTNTNGAGLPGFATEWGAFTTGNTLGGIFPAGGTFDENDLVTVSIGGNDGRTYQSGNASLGILPGDVAGAPAAAAGAVAAAEVGLDALVGAGAQNISFLALNTALAPEVAGNLPAQDVRNAYSAAFNVGIQDVLAGYAADGVMVHYLDLELVADRIVADPAAYGFTSTGACTPAPLCVTDSNYANQFLFYVDNLHLTSAGFAVVAKYVATQLQAPLTLEAPSELGLETARQFGRTLSSRVDLSSPRDGEVAQGAHLFIVGDTFSRDVKADESSDHYDLDGVGATVGLSYGFPNGTVGIAANYTRPKAKFIGDIARTETKTWQVGGFAGYAIAGAFAQGYIGYGKDDHDLTRLGVIDSLSADADGSHWLAGAKAGYLMPLCVFRAGPVVALDYAKAKVDGYTEEGDAALALDVDSISAKSLTGSLGAELRGDFDNSGISVRPFVSAMLQKELSDGGRTIRFAQTSAPGIVNGWSVGDDSKKVYGRVSGGGSAAILSGVTLNALASTTIGRDGGNDVSAQVGLDVGF